MRAPSRYDLYERCAQDPERDVRLLRAIHAGRPRVLAEDFSGTAALSRRWVRASREARAIATDLDPEPLRHARLLPGRRGARVRAVVADARAAPGRADVIAVLNFSIGELHERRELLDYLRHARSRLRRGGVLAIDLYAGADAFVLGRTRDVRPGPHGMRISYSWEQRHADPVSGLVVNTMSFRVVRPGSPAVVLRDAFVYHWRLWSIPELRDAMLEAGFGMVEVYPRAEHAVDHTGETHVRPFDPADELASGVLALVVARDG